MSKNYLAAVECGTSKTAVLIGAVDSEGRLEIAGFASVPAAGAVFKGDIVNSELAEHNFDTALEQAAAAAGIDCSDIGLYSLLLSGSRVESGIFSGVVDLPGVEHVINQADLDLAADNARDELPGRDNYLICSEQCWYQVNGGKVLSPRGMHGRRLVSSLHLIYAPKSDVDNYFHLFDNLSIENEYLLSFFPPLAETGLLTENEKRDGVLLIDLGAGTAEYVYYFEGVLLNSGVLPVGMNHAANDIAVGMGINFKTASKILEQNLIALCRQQGQTMLSSKTIQLPLESLETIVECRLKEIFQVIRGRIWPKSSAPHPDLNVVLTGGGAAYPNITDFAGEAFGCDCRAATVPELPGMPEELNSGRYTALCGALTSIAENKSLRPRGDASFNPLRMFWKGGRQ